MGDRANCYLTNRNKEGRLESWLDLYWHWGGSEVEKVAATALADARTRWYDPSYGTALFLKSLHKDDSWPSGISIGDFDDNEHEVIEVCWSDRKVRVWSPAYHGKLHVLNDLDYASSTRSFEQFCKDNL